MKDLSNSYLGQYYLTEVIGRGSTSVVYKAYQSSLNRYVAVKVLLHHLEKQYAARFIVKAKMTECVTGRVQRAQTNFRFTFERDDVLVFNKSIYMNIR